MSVFDRKILNSNSKGLRGKTPYEYQRTPGKGRIVVLGDSFIFGDEVSDVGTYAHDLESALLDTEVLNLGVTGYGHDQKLLYLKEEGVEYHPDVGSCPPAELKPEQRSSESRPNSDRVRVGPSFSRGARL